MFASTRQDARVMEARYEDYPVTIRNFIGTGAKVGGGGPQAYLANVPPGKAVHPHFHPVDQFQVFFGAGSTELLFFTLRAKATSEHHPMPGSRDKMLRKPGRSLHARVALDGSTDAHLGGLRTIIERKPDGLAAYHLRVDPGESAFAPSSDGAGGQYFIVVKGEMRCSTGRFPFQSCLYLGAKEEPLNMSAGNSEGFEVLVLQYPRALQ